MKSSTKPSAPEQQARSGYESVYQLAPQDRIQVIKRGIPADYIDHLSARMNIPKENVIVFLGFSRATINRKVRQRRNLSSDESARVLGIEYLIGQVEHMVRESGNPEQFDAARWVSNWLNAPLPALGGETPASYMDTFEGQKLVSNLLAQAQSGAYA